MAKSWIGAFIKFQTLTLGHFGMGCHFILVQPLWHMHENKQILEIFILVHQKTMISWSGEAWDLESEALPCTRIKISRKF